MKKVISEIRSLIEQLNFDDTFIIDDINDRSVSYKRFFSECYGTAKYIQDNNPGKSVIAVMENSYELALLYFAVMLTDKRVMVVDPQKGDDEIKGILKDIEQAGVFVDSGKEQLGDTIHQILQYPDLDSFDDVEDIKDILLQSLEKRDAKQPYLVTFTSGTTGVTKGVEHTLDNLLLTAIALDGKVKKGNCVFMHVMPMTYMAGILNSLFYPFVVGASIVITKRFSVISARSFWKKVIKYNVTLFWVSPSMLMMIDQLDRGHDGEEYCRNSKPVFLVGTAPLTSELRKKFNERYGVTVYASYGLSETLFISVENDESLAICDPDCVGSILDGVEYRFTEAGEMQIDVPWMYLGYTNENTADYFDGKHYKSGDLAEVRKGCLYITGRSKDLIIKGGMNISPVLIEKVANKNDFIEESVCIGVKDKSGEERICLAFTANTNSISEDEIKDTLRKQVLIELGKNYAIDYLWKLTSIPRNINGKIDKNVLKANWNKDSEEAKGENN